MKNTFYTFTAYTEEKCSYRHYYKITEKELDAMIMRYNPEIKTIDKNIREQFIAENISDFDYYQSKVYETDTLEFGFGEDVTAVEVEEETV